MTYIFLWLIELTFKPVLFIILLILFIYMFTHTAIFPIKDVKFHGDLDNIPSALLHKVTYHSLSENYFGIELSKISDMFLSLSRVRSVHINRGWPWCLHVIIEQHVPLVRWGRDRLLSVHGDIFEGYLENRLPQVSAPIGSEQDIMHHYLVFKELLTSIGLFIERLSLNERYSWTIETTSQLTIRLGRDWSGSPVIDRVKYFVSVYDELCENVWKNNFSVDVVDLRYLQGFAVHTQESNYNRLSCYK